MPPLTVSGDQVQDAVVVQVAGDLDAASANALRTGLRGALPTAARQPSRLLVVDLTSQLLRRRRLNAMLDCRDEGGGATRHDDACCRSTGVTDPSGHRLGDVLPVHPPWPPHWKAPGRPGNRRGQPPPA